MSNLKSSTTKKVSTTSPKHCTGSPLNIREKLVCKSGRRSGWHQGIFSQGCVILIIVLLFVVVVVVVRLAPRLLISFSVRCCWFLLLLLFVMFFVDVGIVVFVGDVLLLLLISLLFDQVRGWLLASTAAGQG